MTTNATDPVFCLESLDRYEPEATLTTVMKSSEKTPRTKLETSMQSTGSAVSKGYGRYVLYHDVLRFMIAVKEASK